MSPSSLAEVARRSGVSLATASRVLNPQSEHPVSPALRARVLAMAEELDYTVNALAQGLKVRRTRTVLVVVHDIRDPYFNEHARGVTDRAAAAGYLTVICNSDRDPDTELRYVQLGCDHRVSGIIFVGGGIDSERYRKGMRRRLAALADYGGKAVALGPRRDRLPAEVADNVAGARAAVEHLIELGHERIGFVNGPPRILTSPERLAGYREGLEAAGIRFDERLVRSGGFTEAGGAAALADLLSLPERPTAVVTANDTMAIGCMGELAGRGLRVPEDLSLIGFDDIPVMRWLNPPLTTVRIPMRDIGVAGMQRLLALLDGDDRGRRVNTHATELVVRASTAPPARRR